MFVPYEPSVVRGRGPQYILRPGLAAPSVFSSTGWDSALHFYGFVAWEAKTRVSGIMIESVEHTIAKRACAFFTWAMVVDMTIAVLRHAGPLHIGLFLPRGGTRGLVEDAT